MEATSCAWGLANSVCFPPVYDKWKSWLNPKSVIWKLRLVRRIPEELSLTLVFTQELLDCYKS